MTQPTATERKVTHGSFTIDRLLPASPVRVFKAFSDPQIKYRWFGQTDDWENGPHELDFRIGGKETASGRPPGGGPVSKYEGIYRDIVENERIILTYDMWADQTLISVSVATFEFKPEGDRTRLLMTEQDAFLDGYDDKGSREHGSRLIIDALEREIRSQVGES
jgi:uncharacterized protein YndB with AHSA1/START domain